MDLWLLLYITVIVTRWSSCWFTARPHLPAWQGCFGEVWLHRCSHCLWRRHGACEQQCGTLSVSEGICCNDCLAGAHFQPRLHSAWCLHMAISVAGTAWGCRSKAQAEISTSPLRDDPAQPQLAWEEAVGQGELPGGPGASSGSNGSRNATGTRGSNSPRPGGAALFYISWRFNLVLEVPL